MPRQTGTSGMRLDGKREQPPKLLPPPREGWFRFEWRHLSRSAPHLAQLMFATATTQQGRRTTLLHRHCEPPTRTRVPPSSPRTATSAVAHLPSHRVPRSPEPLMCAGTRDRPPPLLMAAAWWRSQPSRIDVHRTSAVTVDGIIDLVYDLVRGDDAHTSRADASADRTHDPFARTHAPSARPRPRVFPAARDTSQRGPEGVKKGKTRAFIYGSRASASYQSAAALSFSRSRVRAARGMSVG